jgi:hypothetical protein
LFILFFGVFANTAVSNNWNWAIPVVFLGTYGLHAFYKFLLTAETIRQVNEDRRSGALELLLVTPAEPGDIVRAQIQATVRKWLPVMLALGWCNYMWMGARTFDREEVIQAILPISVLLLVSDTIVLPYRGLLRALHGERYTLTVFKTFFRTQGPPLGLIAFMLGMAIGSTTQSAARNCFVAWGIICVVYNVVLVVDARVRLRKHFRKLAAGESIPAVWGRRVLPILSARQTYPAVGRTA